MSSPLNGAILLGTTQLFKWTDTYGDQVHLRITDSDNNILLSRYYNGQEGIANNLPSDGSTIYVKLDTITVEGWETKNYTYTAYLAKPSNPSNIILSDVSFDAVTLKWSDNTNTEQGYRIYKGSTLIATLPANTTSYQLDNLVEGGSYTFTIKAFNGTGESEGLVITFIKDANIAWMIPAIYYPILLTQ